MEGLNVSVITMREGGFIELINILFFNPNFFATLFCKPFKSVQKRGEDLAVQEEVILDKKENV